jgi:hypothetical protein
MPLFHTSYHHCCFKISLAHTQSVLLRIPHPIIIIAFTLFSTCYQSDHFSIIGHLLLVYFILNFIKYDLV